MWRTVYKLVKQLGDAPDLAEPAKVAVAVKAQLDKFKLLLPLFQCLCNRGLRPRHWAQISEAVGFEIKGEDGTTFRQLLRLKVRRPTEGLHAAGDCTRDGRVNLSTGRPLFCDTSCSECLLVPSFAPFWQHNDRLSVAAQVIGLILGFLPFKFYGDVWALMSIRKEDIGGADR